MIDKHTLPNGIRVVAEQIPHVRSVAIGLWIGTGSRHESAETNGISHFFEHMMFKGTKRRTARQLADTFDEIGGQVNAFTSKELTCYYAKVLDQHLNVALDVLSDMFFQSVLHPEDIKKERKVIEEEIRMVEDTPDDIVHDWLSQAAMARHSLGFPILGSIDNLRRFDQEALLSFQEKYYTSDRLVIALAGHLPDNYLEQVADFFASWTSRREDVGSIIPEFTAGVIHRKKETEQTHICLGLPGLSIRDPRIYSLILLNNLVGGNMSSRLFQEVREERGLAYSVYSYHSAYRDGGLFTLYAGTGHGQANQVLDLLFRILDEVRQTGVTEEELRKGKEQLKGSLMMSLESTNNRMSRLGKNELLLGKHRSLDEIVDEVESLTRQDLLETAQSIFSNPTALSVISPDGTVPSAYRRDALVV
ncbi:M16 family metallopeptidase [Desmospora profundinema]|uniref:Zn-dependent peptidase n=1 Tax=Desmospora profundinema TaxID=1571184 RepID=A0ABU1IHG7_9BACL|nr:pitrilysin family protein [Desmospora profundinema]MDR6224224.1 putative Zn-dependent peptidase [Desmospora profundinema]